MSRHDDHLLLAERHLSAAESRVERQARLIGQLEAQGLPTDLARALLSSFQDTLEQMRVHRDFLQGEGAQD